MLKVILLLAALTALFIFLYELGFMPIQSKSAVFFVGSANGTGARFTACSGYIKRIVRFKADGTCTFILDTELSKGSLSVELLNASRQPVMQLNERNRTATITVEKKTKYYLITRFKTATGRYSLIRES